VVCATYIKVLHAFVVVWYMGDKYEESYEGCLYWYKKKYVFILYMNYIT
jgi:hypothetical protein